ncbi:ABC transporter ATP-binding protein uup [Aquicella siphonis]|uniref:ATP-binding protein Uup n=1 Tax=Aquicella siphonis TaxID=254247 RepID=A0A5E4PKT1_9COXI|nr:ATP-binding cassette domain-containing protein [Aquicella siphonis]VVC77031.1 ABC transporter ATP-binding protein uup [Aquicella siphonis]
MTNLVTLDNVSLAYGLDALLDDVKLQIGKGERVCLIGRNGAGKSSLLKIIEGTLTPDRGSVWRKPHLRCARLAQDLPLNLQMSVYEFVSEGLLETGQLLAEYHALTHRLGQGHTQSEFAQLEKIQHQIDALNGWEFENNINSILSRLELDPDKRLTDLSGGWLRRAALAKSLVAAPDLLLLDEPTNHLDIEAIQWLEEQLLASGCGLVFITHDRALLQRLATRIIELDRGHLTSWPGDYKNFLRRKEEMLHAEAKQNADFDKKLAQEEIWIRQGIKARRTRNEGRVRALEAMRRQRGQRREIQGKASFNVNEGDRSGQLVIEAYDISHGFDEKPVIRNFSIRIMRGDRLGLIGPNGVGKSTLLNLLLGKITPRQGTVTLGTKLQIAYFDQQRRSLDPEKTVIDNVLEGSEWVECNGHRKHIMSYLTEFLFTPQRARTPVKALSGGECNRLLLAKLFSKPANLLVMDEPTNDLDIETLELLEELLSDYQGTMLLVSHDRAFLDNVVTSLLVFEGDGRIQEYVGGYSQWRQQQKNIQSGEKSSLIRPDTGKAACTQIRQSKKLSYKDQKELDGLPTLIENLESAQHRVQEEINHPDFYKQDQKTVSETLNKLNQLESDLEKAYQRWDELESLVRSLQRDS